MRQATDDRRDEVLSAMHAVLQGDNGLSRCCVAKALPKLDPDGVTSGAWLSDALADPDPDLRMDCAAALGRMRLVGATAPLVEHLRHDPDGEVRLQAVQALSAIKSPAATEPLIACLAMDAHADLDGPGDDMEYDFGIEIQSQALDALGKMGAAEAAGPVIALARDEDFEDLQESAYRVLAELDTDDAKAFLLAELRRGGAMARRRAARALGFSPAFRAAGGALPPDLEDGLARALCDGNARVRVSAVQALGANPTPQIAASLSLLLSDTDADVRKETAAVLGRLRGPEIVGRLHGLLAETDPKVRRGIVQVLGDIADPASLAPLSALLEGDDGDLLYDVIGALGRIGAPGPEARLIAVLSEPRHHSTLRVQAARALGAIAPPENPTEDGDEPQPSAEQALNAALLDDNASVRHAALSALAEIAPEGAVDKLVALLRDDLTPPPDDVPVETLARVDPVAAETSTLASTMAGLQDLAVPPPAQAPRGEAAGTRVKILAARLLGGIAAPGSAVVDDLIEAARTAPDGLRGEALRALGRIGDARALPVVLDALNAKERDLRLAALDAVGGFALGADAASRLAHLLDDPDPALRQRTIETLAAASGQDAAPLFGRALNDEDAGVCRAVLKALSKATYRPDQLDRVIDLMFAFSGDLRDDAAAALRRVGARDGAVRLLAMLGDPTREEHHWICIDALATLYARPEAG